MKHPYFSAAWQSELKYVWDSRTVTGVLEQKPCRGKQAVNLSVMSGVKTPDGEPALLVRAMNDISRRILFCTQEFYIEQGDSACCEFQWLAPHEMTIGLEFLKHRRSVRCEKGWNIIRLDVPAAHRLEYERETMYLSLEGMKDDDCGWMGTLRFHLRTTRSVPPLQFPTKEIKPGTDWVECDLSDLYVKKNSILDFSYLVPAENLDELGRVTVSPDGHFSYANCPEKRVRFFGHSMALTRSNIPNTHSEIEAFADALRNQGYNLVRIHGLNALLMDASRGWDGTLPVKPAQIPVLADAEERLHYFIFALKKRGIHLYLDLCTFFNGWHSGDVWRNGGIWIMEKEGMTRYSSQFLDGDPLVRGNYRAGVIRVMTALNPYTGMRLADDPCIAFVLGFNELQIHPCKSWATRLRKSKKREAELQFDTMEETAQFIDKTIAETGYTGLVNQYDNSRKLVNLAVGFRYPSVTNHYYHWCPHKFFYPGSSQGASSTLFSGIGYMRRSAQLRPIGKPYGMTEYGEPYWNSHRFQQGLDFGPYSAFQDFDILIVHSTPVMKSGGELRPFSGGNDPAVRAAEVITGCSFLRRDFSPARHRAVWEFDRTFMMANFSRWPKSTIAFTALLTGIGLAYENHPAADLRFPLEVTPSGINEYFGPDYYQHFRGSVKFNALVEELRRRGILSKSNATNPANGIYETESGELKLDIIREILTAIAPRLEGALLPASQSATLPHINILPGNVEGAMALIAQDGLSDLDHCRRALLVCSTNALNSGSKFLIRDDAEEDGKYISDTEGRIYRPQAGEEVLLDNGHTPVLRQVRRGSFEVTLPAIRHPRIYAVKFNGERAGTVDFVAKDGIIRFQLAESPSPFFEIIDVELEKKTYSI